MELQDIKPVVVCWSPQLAYIKKRKCDFGVYDPRGMLLDRYNTLEAALSDTYEPITQKDEIERLIVTHKRSFRLANYLHNGSVLNL